MRQILTRNRAASASTPPGRSCSRASPSWSYEALSYHALEAQSEAYWQAIRTYQPAPGKELWNHFARLMSGQVAAEAPVVPEPAQSGIRITTGSGKSEAFRQVIAARYIPEAKRLQLPHRVLIAVPTHKLAAEARAKMPHGVTVAIWQGLKATKLGTNEPMCLNHAAVDAALKLGADVETTACRRGQRGGPPILCPFYDKCPYQAQRAAAFDSDVLFVAHEGLFQLPPGVGGFGLVIIDEAFWQKGLSGAREDDRPRLAIAGICEEFKNFPVWVRAGQESKPEWKKIEREAAKVEAPKRKASKREARRRRKALKRGEKALKYGREALKRERRKPSKRERRELAKRKRRELGSAT